MADVRQLVTGDTPEAVAYALLCGIAEAEGKRVDGAFVIKAERKWLLDTYAECLEAVKLPSNRERPTP